MRTEMFRLAGLDFTARISGLAISGGFGKQIVGFGEKRFGDFAVQVGVAAVLVGKRIEDAVLSRAQS